jgi:hypothetical protein
MFVHSASDTLAFGAAASTRYNAPETDKVSINPESLVKLFRTFAMLTGALGAAGWVGLQIKPQPFVPYDTGAADLPMVPLTAGLPAPVERFYRTVYGERVPQIHSVVVTGRATIRPVANIPLPARFVFIHRAGYDYRHYFEATFFGKPFLKVNEGYVDGVSFFESPMGSYTNDLNTNQGANLALWAEAAWFPAILLTDLRVRWQAVDDRSALLYVPFEDKQEHFLVRFNPATGLIDLMEAMRYRDPGEGREKILWITRSEPGPTLPGSVLPAAGSATWLDQGRPWAVMTLEAIAYNVDVSALLQARGPVDS